MTWREPWRFSGETAQRALQEQFKVKTLEGFGFEDRSPAVCAAGAAVEYARETQRGGCDHLLRLEKVDAGAHLVLDRATRSCLELIETQRGARREGSLLDTIDATLSPMGAAHARSTSAARRRGDQAPQGGVTEFVEGPFLREEAWVPADVLDVERLVAKLSTGRATPATSSRWPVRCGSSSPPQDARGGLQQRPRGPRGVPDPITTSSRASTS